MSSLTDEPITNDTLNEKHLDLDDQLPSKIAEAYLVAAMAKHKNNTNNQKNVHIDEMVIPQDTLRGVNISLSIQDYQTKDIGITLQDTNNPQIQIESTWNELILSSCDDKELSNNNEQSALQNEMIQRILNKTTAILNSEIKLLVCGGLEAFHEHNSTRRRLSQMKDLANSRAKECKQLQDSEAQSQLAVSVSFIFKFILKC